MKFEYKDYELSNAIIDIAAGPFGSNLKVSCFTETGFPIIDGANLKGITVTDNITKFVSEDKARSLHRSIAKRRDIVVTISGNVGQISYIPDNSQYAEYLCSQRQFRVTFDESKIYVPYLVYYLHSVEGQSKILAFANQTGVPALSQPLKNFRKIKIDLPSLENQHKIADILSTLDKKIAINQAINDNLADIIQSVYQNRFSSTRSDVTAGVLADICSYSKDKVPVLDLNNSNYYSTENMQSDKKGAVDAATLPTIAQTTKCRKGDVLISNIRPYFKKIVYCQFDCGCSTDVLCFCPKESALSAFLFSTLYADHFFDFMAAGAKGTKMPRGDKQQIMTYPIYLPSADELAEFNSIAIPALTQMECSRLENTRLIALRDALLPKLMSGKLDVSAIEL